jgi:hypothetical protein
MRQAVMNARFVVFALGRYARNNQGHTNAAFTRIKLVGTLW